MKITNEGITQTIKTDRMHWFLDSSFGLKCNSANFTAEILCPNGKQPTVQGLHYQDWLKTLLEFKVVYDVRNRTLDLQYYQRLLEKDDPLLGVENTTLEYITKVLFEISKSVLDEGFEIKSLSYEL